MGDDALESALRALGRCDRSLHEIEVRLVEQGFAREDRERALETLVRTELLDDERFAHDRARSLAGRGAGDALIRHDLSQAGVDPDVVEGAIDSLEPELERAGRIVAARGPSPRTARYLHGRGYASEVVLAVVATGEGGELP